MTGRIVSRAVTLETADQLHRSGRPYTAPVTLTFDPTAPFEVWFIFPQRLCKHWVISRDLLIDGMIGPVGIGDVRIFPLGRHSVGIILDNGQDSACLKMNRKALARFLSDTASADDFLPDLETWMTEATR